MQSARGVLCGFAGGIFLFATTLCAANLDTIGVTLLRQVDVTLQGSNVPVVQAEGAENTNSPATFEVNPAAVGQPASLFTYVSTAGTASTYPNSVGAESGHADAVAANFYGTSGGVAPQIAHVENYEATHFYESVVLVSASTSGQVVNQSFVFTPASATVADQNYDNYAAQHGTLFVSAVGNGGAVNSPGTCYNGIGVGVMDGSTSVGPTTDGRSKPDLTAPGGYTSFSTPYVAGAAAVLLQAAKRGDGGANLSTATNSRTLKALLLNGAVKPVDWTNSSATPLDVRYGAGIVNVFNAWNQLTGGSHPFIETTTTTTTGAHPPGGSTGNVPVRVGWDFNSISTLPTQNKINHYYFDLTNADSTLTATLVWQRQNGQSTVNDLNLFLYRIADGSLVASSTSAVDNVEHVFVPRLAPGRYDLQVLKNGGVTQVSMGETYALAFEMFTMPLRIVSRTAASF